MCRLLLVVESCPHIARSRVLQACTRRYCPLRGEHHALPVAFAIRKSTEP